MDNHLTNIYIKDFKCFQDFKADGFKRVNLIGGKNNVGKTAFMEACLLATTNDVGSIYVDILTIQSQRNIINTLIEPYLPEKVLSELINKNNDFNLTSNLGKRSIETKESSYEITVKSKEIMSFQHLVNLLQNRTNGNLKFSLSPSYISSYLITDLSLRLFIGELKIQNKYDSLNDILNKAFDIELVDVIDNKIYIKKDNKFAPLYEYGQGVKSYINILVSLLIDNSGYVFIDEIENGLHWTVLDKFWEIILRISQDRKIQVFATTHSKECIESFARVSKKLEDEDIAFIELGKNKKNELDSIVMDSEMFLRFIKMGNEVRGW